jgi:hypothetical protein
MAMHLDFVVPGFSKCGTTSLCDMLAGHPDIFMPENKEPNFFAFPNLWGNWEWYESLFAPGAGKRLWGEGSTFYSAASEEQRVRERMLSRFPDVRLIFIARDPLARIESSYREFHNSGTRYAVAAPYSFMEAFRALPNLIEDTRYWSRLENYREHMPDDHIHVVFFEDLIRDARTALAGCFEFLGADPKAAPTELRQLNAGQTKYYDTRLMRWLRLHPVLGQPLSRMTLEQQDKYAIPLGLRRRFGNRPLLAGEPEARAHVMQMLGEECRQLLAWCGKPVDFWPSMTEG